jgi:hypothetical protein
MMLSGPAIVMLLALLAEAGKYSRAYDLWFSQTQVLERFDFSMDTRNTACEN